MVHWLILHSYEDEEVPVSIPGWINLRNVLFLNLSRSGHSGVLFVRTYSIGNSLVGDDNWWARQANYFILNSHMANPSKFKIKFKIWLSCIYHERNNWPVPTDNSAKTIVIFRGPKYYLPRALWRYVCTLLPEGTSHEDRAGNPSGGEHSTNNAINTRLSQISPSHQGAIYSWALRVLNPAHIYHRRFSQLN